MKFWDWVIKIIFAIILAIMFYNNTKMWIWGTILYVIYFFVVDNRFDTHEKEFYDNGQLKYKKSKKNGFIEEEYYFQNWNLESRERYKRSKLIDRVYYESNGNIISHFYIDNWNRVIDDYYDDWTLRLHEIQGKDVTHTTRYHENWKLWEEWELKDLKKNWIWKHYTVNGELDEEDEYNMWMVLGRRTYENWKIHVDSKYKDWYRDEDYQFDEDWNLVSKTVYTNEYKTVTDYRNWWKIEKYKISRIDDRYKERSYSFFPE